MSIRQSLRLRKHKSTMSKISSLSEEQANGWLQPKGWNTLIELVRRMQSMPSHKIPDGAAGRGALAHDIADEMASGGEVLISVVESDVWGGPECDFVFDHFVQTGLDIASVASPGSRTYIVRDEDYLYGILSLASFYSWGVLVATNNLDYVVLTDHDDWMYLLNEPSKEEFARYILDSYFKT